MSRDVFEIIKQMDKNDIEIQLALQCSPFIMGLRISNLFVISANNFGSLKELLKNTDVSYRVLIRGKETITLFLYNSQLLEVYMNDREVRHILKKLGYVKFNLDSLLEVFQMRYMGYMEGRELFPHEMGLFLGYPIEDVIGYLVNDGKNSLYTGYWKVYDNMPEKIKLFQKFEYAKEAVIRYIAAGMSVPEVIGSYGA